MKITPEQKKEVAKIAKKHGLKLVMLFGSYATGENREDSDLDIALLGHKNINFNKFLKINRGLSEIFERDIDLSIMNRANPLLLRQVEQNALLLFGKENDFLKFKLRAFYRFHDYAPYFKIEAQVNRDLIKQYAN